jgi:hypothetical protein
LEGLFKRQNHLVTSQLFAKKNKDSIPRGLKNHAESLKISVSQMAPQAPRHAVWFFDPCVTLLVVPPRRDPRWGNAKRHFSVLAFCSSQLNIARLFTRFPE